MEDQIELVRGAESSLDSKREKELVDEISRVKKDAEEAHEKLKKVTKEQEETEKKKNKLKEDKKKLKQELEESKKHSGEAGTSKLEAENDELREQIDSLTRVIAEKPQIGQIVEEITDSFQPSLSAPVDEIEKKLEKKREKLKAARKDKHEAEDSVEKLTAQLKTVEVEKHEIEQSVAALKSSLAQSNT